MIVTMSKVKDKEGMLRKVREKHQVTYKEKSYKTNSRLLGRNPTGQKTSE